MNSTKNTKETTSMTEIERNSLQNNQETAAVKKKTERNNADLAPFNYMNEYKKEKADEEEMMNKIL